MSSAAHPDEIVGATERAFARLGGGTIRVGAGRGPAARPRALGSAGAPPCAPDARGAPVFAGGATGSLSHLGHRADQAVTIAVIDPRGRPIGVDVEWSRDARLDPSALLAHGEPADRPLVQILSAKEAAGKALSRWVDRPLDARELRLDWDGDDFAVEPSHGRPRWNGSILGTMARVDRCVISAALGSETGPQPRRTREVTRRLSLRRRRGSDPGRP